MSGNIHHDAVGPLLEEMDGEVAGNTKPDEKLKGQSVWNLYFDHKGMNQGMYKVLWAGFDRDFITATHIQ